MNTVPSYLLLVTLQNVHIDNNVVEENSNYIKRKMMAT